MVALTRAQRKEIVAYVLGIFGVEDEDIENIVETLKLDSVLKLQGMTTELLREMRENERLPTRMQHQSKAEGLDEQFQDNSGKS